MKLNSNFNPKIEPLVNSSKELSTWFSRNQETMAYFGFTHPGCDFLDTDSADIYIVILGKMANACLICLETEPHNPDKSTVQNAITAMSGIYESSKEYLSDVAKEQYAIKADEIEKKPGMHK